MLYPGAGKRCACGLEWLPDSMLPGRLADGAVLTVREICSPAKFSRHITGRSTRPAALQAIAADDEQAASVRRDQLAQPLADSGTRQRGIIEYDECRPFHIGFGQIIDGHCFHFDFRRFTERKSAAQIKTLAGPRLVVFDD